MAVFSGTNQPGLPNGPAVPPDSTGAIGPGNYVEAVNSSIGIYDRGLNLLVSSPFNRFFTLPDPNNDYCDPQMEWDPQGNRWFYSLIYCGSPTSGTQSLYVGWSSSADPTSTWCGPYQVDSPYLNDFPRLGHDNNFIVIGVDLYDGRGNFVTSDILATPKPASPDATCATAVAVTHFASPSQPLLNRDSTKVQTAVPVNNAQSVLTEYIVSAEVPDATTSVKNQLMLWHVTRNSDGSPSLIADGQIPVSAYEAPPNVPQPGSTWTIDTIDGRLTQAVAIHDPSAADALAIWTQHTIADPTLPGCGIGQIGPCRSVVRWYEVLPESLSLAQQGEVASLYDYVFNAAISPSSAGDDAFIIFNRGSASLYPVIAAQSRRATTPAGAMDPGELLLAGSGALTFNSSCGSPTPTSPCRWGDYAGLTPDPHLAGVVWGSSQITPVGSAWVTQNFAIAGFSTAPGAPTNVHATAGNHSATVSWTAPASAGASPIVSYTVTPSVGSTPQPSTVVSPPTTAVSLSALENGTSYSFTVAASNSYGPGPASQPSSPVTPEGGPQIGRAETSPPSLPAAGSAVRRDTAPVVAHPASTKRGMPAVVPPSGPTAQPPAYGDDQATGYQVNAAHTGAQPADPLSLPLHQRWSVDLGATVSYPVIAAGKVYVITASTLPGNPGISKLIALNQSDGSTAWTVTLPYSIYGYTGIAYDAGRILAVTYTGDLSAFDAGNGLPLWTTHLAGKQSWWNGPPVSFSGSIYTLGTGVGGTLYANRESDGTTVWQMDVMAGAAPALVPGNAYLNFGNGDAQDIDTRARSVTWTEESGNTGPGGPPAVVYGGRLYNLDPASNALPQPLSRVIDAASGSNIGSFVASQLPAFGGSRGFFVDLSKVEAHDVATNALLWTFTADAQVNIAPLVVNTHVIIGSSSGMLYVLNAATGEVVWNGNVGKPIAASGGPLMGLNCGQGLLVVPAASTVVAYD